jgi:hypothetical protein
LPFLVLLSLIVAMDGEGWNRPELAIHKNPVNFRDVAED